MNPTETPNALDYLNQIAPKMPKRSIFDNKLKLAIYVLGGIFVITILSIIAIALAKSLPLNIKPTDKLATRLIIAQEISDIGADKIRSGDLRILNEGLASGLAQINGDLQTLLAAEGVDLENIDTSLLPTEISSTAQESFDQSTTTAMYNRSFAKEIVFRLDLIRISMDQVSRTTGNNELKTALAVALEQIATLRKSFAEYAI
jgi:hypothetical protein